MKYLSIFTPDQKAAHIPPSKEKMEAMGKLMEEAVKDGWLVMTGGLFPAAQGGARVRASSDQITVLDGPYTESKEMVAGFAILEAKSREEVIEMTRNFLKVAGDGECELRQIMMQPDGDCGQ